MKICFGVFYGILSDYTLKTMKDMNIERLIDIAQSAALFVTGYGGGVIFHKYRKKKEEASARSEEINADLAEIGAYKKRIASLADEVKTLTDNLDIANKKMLDANKAINDIQIKLQEVEKQRDAYANLVKEQEITIEQLTSIKEMYQEKNRLQNMQIAKMKKEIARLKEVEQQ